MESKKSLISREEAINGVNLHLKKWGLLDNKG